jgi:hypothetical protein
VIEGHDKGRLESVRLYAGLGVFAVLAGSYFLVVHGDVPWLQQLKGLNLRTSSYRVLVRLGVIVAFGGAYVAERFLRVKQGRVELHQDRIVFLKSRSEFRWWGWLGYRGSETKLHRVELPWSDVRSFDDGSSEFVMLVGKDGSSSYLTIPTLREEDRVKVLALLVERGVPRAET